MKILTWNVSGNYTTKMGNLKNKLTSEEQAIITGKGYTIT